VGGAKLPCRPGRREADSARGAGPEWFASTGIQPCEVVYEDLARDRLAVANAVLEFLRLPQLDAGHLPPVRYRKQADSLTERRFGFPAAGAAGAGEQLGPGQEFAGQRDDLAPYLVLRVAVRRQVAQPGAERTLDTCR
jgi:hypothetical protein